MGPADHFLVVVLPLIAYSLFRHRRLPSGNVILVVLIATQLPDLIDKPLAWTFGITPSGRLVAHSLTVGVPAAVAVGTVARRFGYRALGVAFVAGYLSHVAVDHAPLLILGTDYYFFPNAFWPLLEANPDHEPSFAAHSPEPDRSALGEAAVVALVCAYAVADSYRKRRRTDR